MQAELKYVPLGALEPSADNVRKTYDPVKHAELVASVREHGILTPLVVRPSAIKVDRFEVAAGHRRQRAALEAGLDVVPVSVRPMDDRTFREVMLTENLQRVDPDPLDEADAYQAMIDDLEYDVPTLAAKFGKSETYVRARLVLTRLAPAVRGALQDGRIELGHAVLLARVDATAQEQLLTGKLLVANALPPARFRPEPDEIEEGWDEGDYDAEAQEGAKVVLTDPVKTRVSIGELREAMAVTLLPLRCVKWDRDDPSLVVTAGSCTACPKRTGANPSLFEELNADDDRCPDAACYETKKLAWLEARVQAVRSQAPTLVVITTKRQRKLKSIAGTPVLREEKEWKTTKPGARGSVPALVVESGMYSVQDQWQELGELRDVKRVTPAPKPAPAAAAASGAKGTTSDRDKAVWDRAGARFQTAVGAVVRALLEAPEDPTDVRDRVLGLLISGGVETDYKIKDEVLRTCIGDVPSDGWIPTRRQALVIAAVVDSGLEVPSWWDSPKPAIDETTGTFELPTVLADVAASAGVDAEAVWAAALTPTAADAAAAVA